MYGFLKLICLRTHFQVTSILSLFRLSQLSSFSFIKKKTYFSPTPNLIMVHCLPRCKSPEHNTKGKLKNSLILKDNPLNKAAKIEGDDACFILTRPCVYQSIWLFTNQSKYPSNSISQLEFRSENGCHGVYYQVDLI